mgnify:CR=1 FL=1
MSDIKRLFVTMKEDAKNDWGYSINALREGDILIIFSTDLSVSYTSKVENDLNEAKVVADIRHIQLNPIDDDDLREEMADQVKEVLLKNNGPITLYFIGSKTKGMLKNKQSNFAKRSNVTGIASNKTFKIGKTPIKHKPETKNSDKINHTGQLSLLDDEIFGALNTLPPMEQGRNDVSNQNRNATQVRNHNLKTGDRTKAVNPKTYSQHKNNTPPINQEAKNEDIHKIEESIFGMTYGNEKQEEVLDPLVEAKADLVGKLADRLYGHIMDLLKNKNNDIVLNINQLYQFMLLLIKTLSVNDLDRSWLTQEPNIKFDIGDEDYLEMRREAVYYYKVCDVLYGEDLWNY